MNGRRLLLEYVKLVLEMPHLELDPAGDTIVDFRIERMPIPDEAKRALMLAFRRGGFVGEWRGQDVVFSPDGARPAGPSDSGLPRLPDDWQATAAFA